MHKSVVKTWGAHITLVCIVLALGAFLRVYHLSQQSYWMDEGYTINAVLAIEERGVSVLDSGVPYSCPLYCYPTAFAAHTFGNNAFSYRIVAAVAGILVVIAVYMAASAMFNAPTALLSAVFLSLSYWQIAWSRQARWYTLFELFFWLSVYAFYQTLYAPKRNMLWAAATAVLVALTIETHTLGYVLPAIFGCWAVVETLRNKTNIRPRTLGLTAVLAFAVAAGAGLTSRHALSGLLAYVHPQYTLAYYGSFYLRNYWLFIVLAIAGLVLTRQKTREVLLLSCIFFAYLLPLSLLANVVEYRYLFHVTPALFVLAAFGLVELCARLQRPAYKAALVGCVFAVFVYTGQGIVVPEPMYFLESDDPTTLPGRPYYAYTPQPDWNAGYAYIQARLTPGDVVLSTQPQLTKIFLHQRGYWLEYNYLGFDTPPPRTHDGRDIYVGAQSVANLAQLQSLTNTSHGYLILDHMAADGRIPTETQAYIQEHFELAYNKKTNSYSEVFVYRF